MKLLRFLYLVEEIQPVVFFEEEIVNQDNI